MAHTISTHCPSPNVAGNNDIRDSAHCGFSTDDPETTAKVAAFVLGVLAAVGASLLVGPVAGILIGIGVGIASFLTIKIANNCKVVYDRSHVQVVVGHPVPWHQRIIDWFQVPRGQPVTPGGHMGRVHIINGARSGNSPCGGNFCGQGAAPATVVRPGTHMPHGHVVSGPAASRPAVPNRVSGQHLPGEYVTSSPAPGRSPVAGGAPGQHLGRGHFPQAVGS